MKQLDRDQAKFFKIWFVNICTDGRYDNNIFVRADNEEEAETNAGQYVQEDGDDWEYSVARLADEEPDWDGEKYFTELFKSMLDPESDEYDENSQKLLNGEIEGWCYGSGS